MPIRLTGIHYVNTVPFINIIMNMMKPFMKKELMDKVSNIMTLRQQKLTVYYSFHCVSIIMYNLSTGNEGILRSIGPIGPFSKSQRA